LSLSKIWTWFIIVAFGVAIFNFLFNPNEKQIFAQMVTGKAKDSILVFPNTKDQLSDLSIAKLDSGKVAKQGHYFYKKEFNINEYAVGTTTNPIKTIPQNSLEKSVLNKLKNGEKVRGNKTYYFRELGINTYKVPKSDGMIGISKTAVEISLGLIGVMALFMGLMAIAEKAGGIRFLSRIIGPFFNKLFPGVPKNHPSVGHMMMNFSANLLGLDNAATPFGLKAMQSLQELNPSDTVASDAQVMFLALHASGLTLIPVSIIAIRSSMGASDPTDIFIPCMIATFVATMTSMLIVSFKQKINIFQKTILTWVLGISIFLGLFVTFLVSLEKTVLQNFSSTLSNALILSIFAVIVMVAGLYKKIDVFDSFIDGAKDGFHVAVKIIPYLVGILAAISLLRTSGVFEIVMDGFRFVFSSLPDTRFVDGLPTAMIKPLSGSGARGMMVDAMTSFGPDSFAGKLSGVLQGTSDTTFYVVAVYFGAVGIKNTRYAIGAMLLADLAGIITSILLAYLFFG